MHIAAQSVGAACIAAAFVVIFVNKERFGKQHFTSWHGCFGLLGFVLACVNTLMVRDTAGVGACDSKFHSLATMVQGVSRRFFPGKLRRAHNVVGCVTLAVGSLALFSGFRSAWAQRVLELSWLMGVAVAVSIAAVLTLPLWATRTTGRQHAALGRRG